MGTPSAFVDRGREGIGIFYLNYSHLVDERAVVLFYQGDPAGMDSDYFRARRLLGADEGRSCTEDEILRLAYELAWNRYHVCAEAELGTTYHPVH